MILSLTSILLVIISMAKNIAVANTTLTGQDVAANKILVNFDASWENSWRTNTN